MACILMYSYNAYIVRTSVASTNRLIDHATNLLNDLTADRAHSNASSRPLVFVAHSLGGFVCKEAMLLSQDNPEPHLRGIFDYTKGIAFMGTPHNYAARKSWAFDTIYCKFLDKRFFRELGDKIPTEKRWTTRVHLLSEEEQAAIETLVRMKMDEAKERVLVN